VGSIPLDRPTIGLQDEFGRRWRGLPTLVAHSSVEGCRSRGHASLTLFFTDMDLSRNLLSQCCLEEGGCQQGLRWQARLPPLWSMDRFLVVMMTLPFLL
jgi:hypothetical protein